MPFPSPDIHRGTRLGALSDFCRYIPPTRASPARLAAAPKGEPPAPQGEARQRRRQRRERERGWVGDEARKGRQDTYAEKSCYYRIRGYLLCGSDL
ncbi:MAG: hypothetical protein QME51_04290 [Planctomycetota bacterium]|nr:hypothetical protein [Planctomycetota bacterium]MDI6787570.1 hypothetical protein [Planctomycetota bacterium]